MYPDGCLVVDDRLELVRSALIRVLSVGLLPSVNADRPCLERLAPLSAAVTTTSADLCTHTLCNYASLSSAKARSVMCEMVNHDLRLWVNELIRFDLTSQPPAVPHPPDTVFAVPPLPACGRTPAFCRGGGELLKIAEEISRGRVAGGVHSKRKASAGPSSRGAGYARKKSSQPCNMFAAMGRCKWRDCIRVHYSTPPGSSSPPVLRVGGGGISVSVWAGSRALAPCTANAPRAAGGGRASGGGASSSE